MNRRQAQRFFSADMEHLWTSPPWVERCRLLLDSFERWLHRSLIPRSHSPVEDAAHLWQAPFVVVAHGQEADPILNYGNRAALALWEMDLETFCNTPSRQTAEPMLRTERAQMLERTARDGYIDDYHGIRISATGRRFAIDRAIVWNVVTDSGERIGQAATFANWRFLDSPRQSDAGNPQP